MDTRRWVDDIALAMHIIESVKNKPSCDVWEIYRVTRMIRIAHGRSVPRHYMSVIRNILNIHPRRFESVFGRKAYMGFWRLKK
jgi:hypothetical protein